MQIHATHLRYATLLSLAITLLLSCSDHGNETAPTGQQGMPATEAEWTLVRQQTAVHSLLTQLTGIATVEADFDARSYTPTYGVARDEAPSFVRAVAVANVAEAESAFRALVGCDTLIRAEAGTLKVDLTNLHFRTDGRIQNLGTLTYHTATDGSERLAWIDVSIGCIPTLKRIDFIDQDSWGNNSSSMATYKYGTLCLYNGSKYTKGLYLCVEENKGSGDSGLLVHLVPGSGPADCSQNLDGDNQGCWKPCHPGTASDAKQYIKFLLGTYVKRTQTYKRDYRNAILAYLGDNATPKDIRTRKDDVIPWGFHESNDLLYTRQKPAAILIDSRFTATSGWLFFGNMREVSYWRVDTKSVSDMGRAATYTYWKDSEWNRFMSDYALYTLNIINFGQQPVEGMVELFFPSPDILWGK